MYKKKLSTIAIVTILTLSMLLAARPMATATPPVITSVIPVTGAVGTKVDVV